MVYKAFRIWLLLLLINKPSYSQSSSTLKDSTNAAFAKFIEAYLLENQLTGPTIGVPVMVILHRTPDQLEVAVTMFVLRSEVEKYPPDQYITINKTVLLIYNGTGRIIPKPKTWILQLIHLIGDKVCNDSPLTLIGRDMAPIPCTFKFDPHEYKLTFEGLKLTNITPFLGQLF